MCHFGFAAAIYRQTGTQYSRTVLHTAIPSPKASPPARNSVGRHRESFMVPVEKRCVCDRCSVQFALQTLHGSLRQKKVVRYDIEGVDGDGDLFLLVIPVLFLPAQQRQSSVLHRIHVQHTGEITDPESKASHNYPQSGAFLSFPYSAWGSALPSRVDVRRCLLPYTRSCYQL